MRTILGSKFETAGAQLCQRLSRKPIMASKAVTTLSYQLSYSISRYFYDLNYHKAKFYICTQFFESTPNAYHSIAVIWLNKQIMIIKYVSKLASSPVMWLFEILAKTEMNISDLTSNSADIHSQTFTIIHIHDYDCNL